jgi:hypothetical protein
MIYFEDLVIKAKTYVDNNKAYYLSVWTKNFIQNVGSHLINDSNPKLSTNQAETLKKVLPNFFKFMTEYQKEDLEKAILFPNFKNELYISPAVKKEARHLGANFIGFRFKYNPELAKQIQESAMAGHFRFDKKTKLWIVQVTQFNFENVFQCIKENRFETDNNLNNWMKLCIDKRKSPSVFVLDKETNCIVANIVANEELEIFVKNFLEGVYV